MQHSARTALMRIKVFSGEKQPICFHIGAICFHIGGQISMQHSARAALMGIKVSAAHPVNGLICLTNLK